MNNKHVLIIPKHANKLQVIKSIEKEKAKTTGPIVVNFRETDGALSRDLLFVLSEKFHTDDLSFFVETDEEKLLCRSFWFTADTEKKDDSLHSLNESHIVTHNMTVWQYFLYELRRGRQHTFYFFKEKLFKKTKTHVMKKSSPHFFLIISGLIVSVTLLLFIFHFAVSKTTISIAPQISVRPVSANIIYSNASGSVFQGKNVLPLKTVSLPVDLSMDFTLSVVDTNSTSNAEGTITLYNELDSDQALKPLTRIVTEGWEVFRIKWWVNIPRSRTLNWVTEIGAVEAEVVADGNDEAGRIIGVRWNIKRWTDLTIPGLKFNRDKVYAKAKNDFAGGTDPQIFLVTEEEVEKFKWILREQLYKTARNKLQEVLDGNKKTFGEDYALLVWEAITYTGELIQMTSPYKFWDAATEVTIKWEVVVQALTYDRLATIKYLEDIFKEWLLRGTDQFIAIHEDTLRVASIVSKAEDNSRIKVTMEMTASTTYDFENATSQLVRHMKNMIAGLPKKEAVNLLINNGNIKEVDIDFSPFWIRSVSSNIDNIEFVIAR